MVGFFMLVVVCAGGGMGTRSPQLGYNHNIPHRGRLYHVQTEDSGFERAHIFTHAFYDGTIVASNKIEYREHKDAQDLDAVVVALMQESHKDMIRKLRSGTFDQRIVSLIGDHPSASNKAEPAPVQVVAEAPSRPIRRPPPEPREVEPHGPPLSPGPPGPTVDPTLSHPVFASAEAQAQVASAAENGPGRSTRGPSRIRRRAVGGIGGQGVSVDTPISLAERRDIIVGKFASEHQAQLDEEILALLREDGSA